MQDPGGAVFIRVRTYFLEKSRFQRGNLRKRDRCIVTEGGNFTIQEPCENSGTSKPASGLVEPLFPNSRILKVILWKNAELGRNYSTISDGNNSDKYSNVTKAGNRMGSGLGCSGHWRPGFRHSPKKASGIKRSYATAELSHIAIFPATVMDMR